MGCRIQVRKRYLEELDKLNRTVVKMGEIATSLINDSVISLANKDAALADKVLKEAEKVDDYELRVEEMCVQLIARQQPMADDLRAITSYMRIIDIPRMSKITQEMVKCAMDSLDQGKALDCVEHLSEKDNEVDALWYQIYRELISMMIENPKIISDATNLLLVARYLERMADHACNIGSRLIYMFTGERRKIQ